MADVSSILRGILCMSITDLRPLFAISYIGLKHGKEPLQFVQQHLKQLIDFIDPYMKLDYFVFDGAFGNNDAVQMVRQLGLHLISKLRHDLALYLPYQGRYSGRGPRKTYGDKLNYQNIPGMYLKTSSTDKDIETKI